MTLMSDANAIIRADRAEIDRLRAEKAELLAALERATSPTCGCRDCVTARAVIKRAKEQA